ncbi:hypothetical protein [Nocardiopsis sp. FIRDI 009]|uniref:hypothetical protein n=1 Tax=Nocardiopsis sp. FIRDI 009 TaxID=714197 RepID=UPI001E3F90E0|nr:hypothetical protein [Nocardiopsis sp. FIRDI 009]
MNENQPVMLNDRDSLDAWARAQGVRVRVASEEWDSITYEAVAESPDGSRSVRQVRFELPPVEALRRLRRTFVVGMWHNVKGSTCNHVRRVVPPVISASGEDLANSVALVARAQVEEERRDVCGATVSNLRVYMVQRCLNWRPF